MNIATPFAFSGNETKEQKDLGALFVRFARKSHPKANIIQLSDMKTSEIEGIDSCYRAPMEALGLWYFDVMNDFQEREFLRVDYDCMIRADVSEVFEYEFDIAIAKEDAKIMNNGVVFVRDREIYKYARKMYMENTGQDNWQDIQKAMSMAIDSGLFRVKRVPSEIYNYVYKRKEVAEKAKIVHFKGDRKVFMRPLFGHEAY